MKKLLFFLLVLSQSVFGQIVNIPDANFKAALVADITINTNGDSEIQVAEATAFTDTIVVTWSSIADLTGIEAFTALTVLYCYGNSLTSLDVSGCTALINLQCHYNSLTSLDVSNNTVLTDLGCSSNLLTSLDVSGCTALIDLSCFYNQLTSIDVSNNTVLKELWCFDNSLNSLDVSNNTALTYLNCNNNLLTSLDVSSNTALTTLACMGNSITSLDVSNNSVLTDLYCPSNSLTGLDVRNGNNVNMLPFGGSFYATGNPNLTCISVDDTEWANANWSSQKDSTAIFSSDCTVGIEDNEPNQPTITTNNNTVTIAGNGTASIYNLLGQEVAKTNLPAIISINEGGVYLVRVQSEGRVVTRKVLLSD
ncbi:MAG: T9SS type A sorting domain-containing protein [Cytophagales bacterium]|nr:T9SS type A sorting domain-containing protein [Cytophagales bacterium]